jgi:hypothetical protein
LLWIRLACILESFILQTQSRYCVISTRRASEEKKGST